MTLPSAAPPSALASTFMMLLQQLPGVGADDAAAPSVIPGLSPETQLNLVWTMVIVVLLFFARRAIVAVVTRRVESQAIRYRWSKTTAYTAFVAGVLILVQVWFTAIQSLGTFLGLVSAGLAIALKDLVADLAGWVFILSRRPFDLGDRVQVGGFTGDVVDRTIFQFTIMEVGNWIDADQSTGRLVHIPNSTVFTQPLANSVAGFPYLWNELKVVVTFESDWRKAKSILDEVAESYTVDITREANAPTRRDDERFLINYRKLTPIVYTSVVDHGVLLTLRYLCGPRARRGTAGELWEHILDAFALAPDVTLAYPTQRLNLDREVRARPVDGVVDAAVRGDSLG